MLKETFRTIGISTSDVAGMACVTDKNIDPEETRYSGDTSIVLHGISGASSPAGAGGSEYGWKLHSVTGALVGKFDLKDPPEKFDEFRYVLTSRSGKLWGMNDETGQMWDFHYGNIVTAPPADQKELNDLDDDEKEPFWVLDGDVKEPSHWENVYGGYQLLPGIGSAIDDKISGEGIFLTGSLGLNTIYNISTHYLSVFHWETGKWRYDLSMPGKIMSMALEDEGHVYCLLANRTVVLVDYVRGQMLGVAKIPFLNKAIGDVGFGGLERTRITWDKAHRRLLIVDPAGTGWRGVRGFSLFPEPVRVTTPIPLRPLRQERYVPVLAQVVDDTNQGVGAYVVEATVAGAGYLLGNPITDVSGNATIMVGCDPAISEDDIPGGPSDPSGDPSGGSETSETITIIAKVKVRRYLPGEMSAPISGAPGGGGGGGGAPGPPSGEPSPGSNLPAIAPNMIDVAIGVYNSGVWDLSDENKYNANGAGAFTAACVTAFHDQDARWGHIRKNSGQTNYQGHAIDACMYKNDDGTVEVYDFVSGAVNPGAVGGHIVWQFMSRNTEYAPLWYY